MCDWDPNIQCLCSELFTTSTLNEEEEGSKKEEEDEESKYLRETDIRLHQLVAWIEDLLNSEELEQYFSQKLPKIDAEVQCHMSQISITSITISDDKKHPKYPLTELSIKRYRLMKKIDCLIKYRNNKAIQESQLKSIIAIREKIEEAKRLLLCHPVERAIEASNKRKMAIECMKKMLTDNFKNLYRSSKVMDRVLVYQKLKRFRRKMRNQRRLEIIRKLAREFRRQEQIDYEQNRTYDYKVKPRGFLMKGLEIVGTKATLFSRFSDKEKLEEEQAIVDEAPTEKTEKGSKKGKKDKKGKDSKKGSKKGDKKKKKDKKGKKGGKKKKDKKKQAKEEPLVDIVEVLKQLQIVLASSEELKQIRKSFELEKQRKDTVDYPYDYNFTYKPLFLDFKDYEQNHYYKKTVTILNASTNTRKFRYLKTLWDQPWDTPTLEIEPVGIQKVFPGLSVQVDIIFESGDRDYLLTGIICFLSYAPNGPVFHFGVPFRCCPFAPDIVMSTSEIIFEKMPIWKATSPAQQAKGKQIILSNVGTKKCTVSITKVQDPLEIEPKWVFPEEIEEVEEEEKEVGGKAKGKKKEGKAKKEKGKGKKKDKKKKEKKKKDKKKKDKKKKDKKKGKKGKKDKKSKKDEEKKRKKMEAELEAKFLQELLDKYLPAPPVVEEEDVEPLETPSKQMVKTVHECVENAFNTFVFDECCFALEPKSRKILKVYFKNIDYAGYYHEKFSIKFFEDVDNSPQFFCMGTRDLLVHGEVTGNFILVQPVTLDYHICVYDSLYQLEFTIHNTATIPHGLTVKVPSSLKKYLYTNGTDFYVPSCQTRTVFLRFSPRKEIVTEKNRYFNLETSVLEFPIYVAVVSKNFLDTPPNRVTVYAILTEPNGVILTPQETQYTEINENNEYVLNLGECSTKETIYTDINLTNTSLAVQHFGFIDLPESVTISPNYGYGIIMPLETKTVTLMYSPESKDIPNFFIEAEAAIGEIIFPISVETIKNKGGVRIEPKKQLNGTVKKLQAIKGASDDDLEKDTSSQMYQEIFCCLHRLTDSDFSNVTITSGTLSSLSLNWKIVRKSEIKEDGATTESLASYKMTAESSRLWLMVKIVTPYSDLSHQLVRFPDTPCGSYSVARIEFRNFVKRAYDAHCICGYIKRNTKAKNYKCAMKFQIAGDNPQITIEPFCGQLDPDDEESKLYLVAKPEVPPEVVEEQAKAIKRQEIIDIKMKALLEKRQRELEAKLKKKRGKKGKADKKKDKKEKDKKGKKGKKGTTSSKSTDTEPPLPQIVVKDEEIKINIFDLYPAEMVLWRNFESYEIKSHFVCTVDYLCTNSTKKRDRLYLDAVCKVIQPDFTLNLKQQRIHFGPVMVGMSTKKVISLQNIQNDPIYPNLSILSPVGPFFCPVPNNLKLESEYILNIPVIFAPNEPKEVTQFFEIRAGRTICTLALSGEGIGPTLKFNPDFVVCRLETPFGNFTEFNLEIDNKTKAPVIINFIKTCELEGYIRGPPPIAKPGDDGKSKKKDKKKDKKGKKGKKDKSSTKGKKIPKFSQELTGDEIYSLEQFFDPRPEEEKPVFDVVSKDDLPNINPNSKKSWKIRFGVLPKQVVADKKEKDGKKDKKKKEKKGKKGKEKKCPPEKPGAKELKYYISKFNVTLGDSTVLKDIVVIAKFCK